MSKFNYSSGLPTVLKQKGYLPGQISKSFGPRYIASGFVDSANSVDAEFGAFVEVNAGDSYAYEVLPVSASTTASELAVVVRDVVGASSNDGIVVGPKDHLAVSLFLGTYGQKGVITAILDSANGGSPAVGGTVYVGTGVNDTVAGVVYATNFGTDCITATGWTFASTKFAPLQATDKYVVSVKYAG